MFDKIVNFFRSMDVEAQDWQHLALGLWVWVVAWVLFGINAWWVGTLFGAALEAFQYFTFDKRALHLRDRIGDVVGYSITLTLLLPALWIVVGGVLWYAALWGYRLIQHREEVKKAEQEYWKLDKDGTTPQQ